MPLNAKNEAKNSTKLSLSRKSRRGNKESSESKLASILPAVVDLNETCEFKEPMSFRGVGQGDERKGQGDERKVRSAESSRPRPGGSKAEDTVPKNTAGDVDDDDKVVLCQVCNKNLNHMNAQRRHQHVNKCIDVSEAEAAIVKQKKEVLEAAKTAILDCPMCGKKFKAVTAKHVHLKKCSKTLNVARDNMVRLLKEQEDERKAMVAAGVVPSSIMHAKPKASGVGKKRRLKEPKSQYEEDVQVAMAMSSSLADPQKSESCNLIGQKQIHSSANKGKGSRKKKTVLEDVCMLTTLTDAVKQKRVEEKVNNILLQEELPEDHMKNIQPLFKSVLHANGSSPHVSECLWSRSTQNTDCGDASMFYVGALMPPISVNTAVTGSKLRRLSTIPGRDSSFVTQRSYTEIKAVERSVSVEEEIAASTQTAVVLAELAVDEQGLQMSQVTSNVDDLHASGFCVQKLAMKAEDREALRSDIPNDYEKMINNRDYSDVTLITSDGRELYAHKVILAARCPRLLQFLRDATIHLDVTSEAAESFLAFIYTGDLSVTSSALNELVCLSDQLELSSLKSACSLLISVEKSLENGSSSRKTEKGYVSSNKEDFLESKLDMKEIFGESSDSDTEDAVDLKEGTDDIHCHGNEGNEICNEEYQEIMCTQRQRIRKEIEKEDNETFKDVNAVDHDVLHRDELEMDHEDMQIKNTKKTVSNSCVKPKVSLKNDIVDLMENIIPASAVVSDCDNVVNGDNNKYEDVVELISDGDNESEGSSNMEVDFETVRKSTEIRLQDKKETSYSEKIENSIKDESNCLQNFDVHIDSKLCSYHDTEISKTDVSVASINNSSADLFGSPTPRKESIPVRQQSEYMENKSSFETPTTAPGRGVSFSTPIDQHSPTFRKRLKQNLKNESLLITPVANVKERRLYPFETPSGNNPEKSDLEESCDFNNTTNNSYDPTNQMPNEVAHNNSSRDCSKLNLKQDEIFNETGNDDDDDLEITGDNFDEILHRSPKFTKKVDMETKSLLKDSNTDGSNTLDTATDFDIQERIDSNDKIDSNDTIDSNDKINSNDVINMTEDEIYQCIDESFNDVDGVVAMETEEDTDNNIGIDRTEHNNALDNSSSNLYDIGKKQTDDHLDSGSEFKKGDETDDSVVEIRSDNSSDDDQTNAKDGSDKEVACRRELHGKHDISSYNDEGEERENNGESYGGKEVGRDNDVDIDNTQDIWDDFDDCGIEYIPTVTSPVLSSPPDALDKVPACDVTPSNTATDRLSLQDGEDSFVINIEDDPTPEGTSGVPESKEGTFKTPSFKKRHEDKKRPWTALSPFTPKPEYDKMATPVLKKAVQRIGVKAVGKKRMIKLLDDVYHQTHQYETDSDCEDDLPTGTQIKSGTQRSQAAIGDGVDDIVASQESMSSQNSDTSELSEESRLYLLSSDSDASSSPQKSSDVNRSLFDFIKKRPELNNRILMYDPLELDVLKKDVKEAGIKCSMDKLMSFLDERCIVYTNRNTRKRVNSRRGRKKDSTKEGSPDILDLCRNICQTENKN